MTSSLSCCGCWPLRPNRRRPSSMQSRQTWHSAGWRPSHLTTSLNGRCHSLSTGFFLLCVLFHHISLPLLLHLQQNSIVTKCSSRNAADLFTIGKKIDSPAVVLMKRFLLCRKALTRYQMLFRHMFYCKHVERVLCNVWISNKDFKQYSLRSPKW